LGDLVDHAEVPALEALGRAQGLLDDAGEQGRPLGIEAQEADRLGVVLLDGLADGAQAEPSVSTFMSSAS
jgi:hypothetical protein